MIKAEPQVSTDVRAAIIKAMKMHTSILENVPRSLILQTDAIRIFAAFFHLAEDLYGSIIKLIESGGACDGGAFALLRPLVEASIRGQWLLRCAKESLATRALSGEDIYPGLPCMIESLDQALGAKMFGPLKNSIKSLHGYTHGGVEQIARRFDPEGNLESTYSDNEKMIALESSAFQFAFFGSTFCRFLSLNDSTGEEGADRIEAAYHSIYAAAP